MSKAPRKSKRQQEELPTCPICMERKVNVSFSRFSANQTNVLIDFAIGVYRSGEE